MKKTSRKFKYTKLIDPAFRVPEELSYALKGSEDRLGKARAVCKWVASSIKDSIVGGRIDSILVEKEGNCLRKSSLAVSLLRSSGFSHEEVFVVILVRRGKNPFEELHALVLVQLGEDVFFDLTTGFSEYRKSLEKILSTHVIVLMFNDEVCLIPS